MEFEIMKALCLPTNAVSKKTAQALDEAGDASLTAAWASRAVPVTFPKGEYGWFVYVPADPVDDPERCPVDLKRLLTLAREACCGWLMLDRDVVEPEGLQIYDW